jgi:hypothetical protein
MTAYVSIPVATAANVLKVPNGALRYKPDLPADEIRALYQKNGIPERAGPRPQSAQTASGSPRPQVAAARKGSTGGAANDSSSRSDEGQTPRFDTQIVWKFLPDKSIVPVRIKTGITDHTFTEMIQELNGDLKAGDDLVTGVAQGHASGAPPGGPGVPRGR